MRELLKVSLSLLGFVLFLGCHMFDAASTPKPGEYPCGPQGTECHDQAAVKDPSERCCGPRQDCAVDDSGPYCAANEGWSGDDPTTWGRKLVRMPRSSPK